MNIVCSCFLVYLATLSRLLRLFSVEWILLWLWNMKKEVVVAYFKVLPKQVLWGAEESYYKLQSVSPNLDRGSTQEPPSMKQRCKPIDSVIQWMDYSYCLILYSKSLVFVVERPMVAMTCITIRSSYGLTMLLLLLLLILILSYILVYHPNRIQTNFSLKMAVFWVVAPCSLVEDYRRFRGAYCLHIKTMSKPQQAPLKRR
jgi:hypothetical protein